MRHISRTIILASTCLLASSLTAAEIYVDPIFNTQVTSNIVYGMGATLNGDIPLLLDIYEPTGPGAPDVSPLVVVIHGGGFQGGSKTNQRSLQQASELGEAGYRVASINYRTINDDPVPIPGPTDNWTETTTFEDRLPAVNPAIADATLAVQWLIDNAGDYGINPNRIGLAGFSAGAIIGLHVGYPELGLDPNIAAVVDMWGAMYGLEAEVDLFDPALMLIHGENDGLVPIAHAEALVARAEDVGLPYNYFPIAGSKHSVDMETIIDGKTLLQHEREFLNEYLVLMPFPLLPGDGNRDHVVDTADYTIWANNFGQMGVGIPGDYNSNGAVDAADYTVWANTFSGTGAAAPLAAVPEPSTALLFLLGVLGLVACGGGRKRRAA